MIIGRTPNIVQQLKLLPFNEIVKFKQVSLVYKAVNGNAPQYIQTMFTNIKDNSNYSLRSSANKKLFVARTHHKSLSYTGVIMWNALPENIKSSKTFTKFKNLYKRQEAVSAYLYSKQMLLFAFARQYIYMF